MKAYDVERRPINQEEKDNTMKKKATDKNRQFIERKCKWTITTK